MSKRSRISGTKKVFWVMVLALAFVAMGLPQMNQAQILGEVTVEREPNGDGMSGPQTVRGFPAVVVGNSDGTLTQLTVAQTTGLPSTNGSPIPPRSTLWIINVNPFTDETDLYRFTLQETTNIGITMTDSGGFHQISSDFQLAAFGVIFGFPTAPIVRPVDLDLLLFTATGAFIDGSFDGLGNILLAGGGLGFPVPDVEFIPNDMEALQGNPFFVPTALPRGRYLLNVDDFTKFIGFVADGGTGGQIISEVNWLYEGGGGTSEYRVLLGNRGLAGGQPPEIAPGRNGNGVLFTRHIIAAEKSRRSNAADEYFEFEVTDPGAYTLNVGMPQNGRRMAGDPGHMIVFQYDDVTQSWSRVGQSVLVYDGFETLANVQLGQGRYVAAMIHNDIKPYQGKFNYAITVLDANEDFVAMQKSYKLPTDEELLQAARDMDLVVGGNSGSDK